MPNFCNNFIQITGEGVSKIKEILEANPKGFMFQSLYPEYKSSGPVENVEAWGCKWDVLIDLNEIIFDHEYISMNLITPWEPCNFFLKKLHEKYDVYVDNKFSERGNNFAGIFTIDPEGINHEVYPYFEGMYRIDFDSFLFELEKFFDDMEDPPSMEELLKEFNYVGESDIHYLKEIYLNVCK
jgi:hypothetical protein